MTSSPDRLPPALPAMWRVLKLGYRHEPGMMSASFLLVLLAALPDAFLALWLKLLGQAVVTGRGRLLLACALGLGATATATWFLGTVSTRVQRRFRDRVTIALEAHVARLGQAEVDHRRAQPAILRGCSGREDGKRQGSRAHPAQRFRHGFAPASTHLRDHVAQQREGRDHLDKP